MLYVYYYNYLYNFKFNNNYYSVLLLGTTD